MKFVCSLVMVEDIERSKRLYADVFGQRIVSDYGENVAFEGGFALHKKEHFAKLIDNRSIKTWSNSFELYFEDDDLEAVEKRMLGAKLTFIHAAKEQPWRQKVLRVYDYDGNIIEVGESLAHLAYRLHLEGKSAEEIAKATNIAIKDLTRIIGEYE